MLRYKIQRKKCRWGGKTRLPAKKRRQESDNVKEEEDGGSWEVKRHVQHIGIMLQQLQRLNRQPGWFKAKAEGEK